MSNQMEPPLWYKKKGLLKEKQFKAQIEQPRQSLGEEILRKDVMWERRTKHFYPNPRQLNELANSMGKMGFKGPPSSWAHSASQSELIRWQRRSRCRFRNRCLQPKPKGAHGCSAAENPRENTLYLTLPVCPSCLASGLGSSCRPYKSTDPRH